MEISGTGSPVGDVYAARVEKLAQDAAKAEGEGAVALIEAAAAPPVGQHGEGTHINTYA